jgi:hypothetical protein
MANGGMRKQVVDSYVQLYDELYSSVKALEAAVDTREKFASVDSVKSF